MTVQAFIEEIQRRYKLGDTLDWTAIRDDLHTEHERAKGPEERVQLLALHKIIMDKVEANITDPVDLEIFRKARDQDYCLLLVRETVSADGNVSPALMDAVTRREIAAGRMPPEHHLRQLIDDALITMSQPGPKPAPRTRFAGLSRFWRKG